MWGSIAIYDDVRRANGIVAVDHRFFIIKVDTRFTNDLEVAQQRAGVQDKSNARSDSQKEAPYSLLRSSADS